MRLSTILSDAFGVYRQFLGRFLLSLIVLFLGLNVISTVLAAQHRAVVAAVVVAITGTLGTSWGQATMIEDIRDERAGRGDASIPELYARTWRHGLRIAVATFLAAIPIGLSFGIIAGIGMSAVTSWEAAVVVLALAAVPVLFLLSAWSLIAPAIVIEGQGIWSAFARSSDLVRPHRWPVLGAVLVTTALGIGATVMLTLPVDHLVAGRAQELIDGAIDDLLFTSLLATLSTVLYYQLIGRPVHESRPDSGWREADVRLAR